MKRNIPENQPSKKSFLNLILLVVIPSHHTLGTLNYMVCWYQKVSKSTGGWPLLKSNQSLWVVGKKNLRTIDPVLLI